MNERQVNGTVLVIDDEGELRQLVQLKLERKGGYRVLTAHNGQTGVALAQAHHPDVIVVDYLMPQMDGLEVIRRLKGDARTSHIPVIMLSSIGDEETMASSLQLGAAAHVTKDSLMAGLPHEVELAVARHRDLH